MSETVKFCYMCDEHTHSYCICCEMPVCSKCYKLTKNKRGKNTICSRCDSFHLDHKVYKWCWICDELTNKYKKITITRPLRCYKPLVNHAERTMWSDYIYLSVCYGCDVAFPWFYPAVKSAPRTNFIEKNAKQMLSSINSIREQRKSQISERLLTMNIPTDLCNIIIDYYKPFRHYEYLYIINLNRYRDIVYDFTDDMVGGTIKQYKAEKKITN